MIDSAEVARRLGVKLSTVYAYVSRGILVSHPTPDSRRRLFDSSEIDAMLRRGSLSQDNRSGLRKLDTSITRLYKSGPYYRGISVVTIAASSSFEDAVALLWDSPPLRGLPALELPPRPEMGQPQIFKWVVLMSESVAILTSDLRRSSIVDSGERILSTLIDSLTESPPFEPGPLFLADGRVIQNSIAGQLVAALYPGEPSRELVRAMNAALIVLADHEFNPAALAVRVSASARVNVYNAVLAGLCASSTPQRTTSAELALQLLLNSERLGVGPAIDEALGFHGIIPGFGHLSSTDVDARFEVLMSFCRELEGEQRLQIVEEILSFVEQHELPRPRVEFALAVMMFVAEMSPRAGDVVSAFASTCGCIAHYLEELLEPPLRFRPEPPTGDEPSVNAGLSR